MGEPQHMPGLRQLGLRGRREHDDKEIARSSALSHPQGVAELAIQEGYGGFDRRIGLKQQQRRTALADTALFVTYVEHIHDKVADTQRIKPLHERARSLRCPQIEKLSPSGECPRYDADDCRRIPGRCANKGCPQLQGNQQARDVVETSLVAGHPEMPHKMSEQFGFAGDSFGPSAATDPEERTIKRCIAHDGPPLYLGTAFS
jgi:hypothetical protein